MKGSGLCIINIHEKRKRGKMKITYFAVYQGAHDVNILSNNSFCALLNTYLCKLVQIDMFLS